MVRRILGIGSHLSTGETGVLFTQATESACGGANSATGPHYCPLDQTVYIDLSFYDELKRRFGATGGDFAQAYVMAHEIGHHVQNELGVMDDVRQIQQSNPASANDYSVRLELQADCFAGVWANSIYQREDVLESGDIEEALNAASAVGDDRIQEITTGRVSPETFTHGTSEQRSIGSMSATRPAMPPRATHSTTTSEQRQPAHWPREVYGKAGDAGAQS